MESARRSNRRIALAGTFVAVVALLAIVGRALVADAIGGPLSAVGAIPADVQGVFVADLGEVRELADSALVDYTIRLAQEAGELPPGDPADAYVDYLEREFDLDLELDLLSWIGRSAAIGVGGDAAATKPETIIAACFVRDEAAAWRFIDMVVERTLSEDPTSRATEPTIAGLRVVALESGDAPVFFGVNGDYMVIANSRESMEASYRTIDAGGSVADADWFQAAYAELDRRAWFKLMIDPQFITDTYDAMADLLDEAIPESYRGLTALGMSFGLDGARITAEVYVEQEEPIDQKGLAPLPLSMISDLRQTPDILFGVAMDEDFGRQTVDQLQAADPRMFDDMVSMALEMFEVDLINDGLAQLGGHFLMSVAVGDSNEEIDFDVSAGLLDAAPVVRAFEHIRSLLLRDGIVVEGREGLILLPDAAATFGVLGDEVVLRLDQMAGEPVPFAETDGYRWLAENFPRGAALYVDIDKLMQLEGTGLDRDSIDDFEAMRLGATFDSGERSVRFTAVIEIDLTDP